MYKHQDGSIVALYYYDWRPDVLRQVKSCSVLWSDVI